MYSGGMGWVKDSRGTPGSVTQLTASPCRSLTWRKKTCDMDPQRYKYIYMCVKINVRTYAPSFSNLAHFLILWVHADKSSEIIAFDCLFHIAGISNVLHAQLQTDRLVYLSFEQVSS